MSRFFKSINDSKIEYEVYYGWDADVKKWFIDLQLPKYGKGNIVKWFDSEENFNKSLNKIS